MKTAVARLYALGAPEGERGEDRDAIAATRHLQRPGHRAFGAEIEKYYRDGHIREIAEYCESDVLNTYRVWLRYELFRGRLSDAEFQGSEATLADFVKPRGNTKPHLTGLM